MLITVARVPLSFASPFRVASIRMNPAKHGGHFWVECGHEQVEMEWMIGEVSFLQGCQNLMYKEMSIVFVICYSDLSLANHKNNNCSC